MDALREIDAPISVGRTFRQIFSVGADAAAIHFGGDSLMLATPVIVYWIEAFATACIRNESGGKYGSLGQAISVQHVAQASAGSEIALELTVAMVFQRSIRFAAQATDPSSARLIAKGTHDRTLFELRDPDLRV